MVSAGGRTGEVGVGLDDGPELVLSRLVHLRTAAVTINVIILILILTLRSIVNMTVSSD
jgi:hypothetical protein